MNCISPPIRQEQAKPYVSSALYLLGPRKGYTEGLPTPNRKQGAVNPSILQSYLSPVGAKMMGRKYKTYRRETAQWGHTNASYSVRKSRALQRIYKNEDEVHKKSKDFLVASTR